jgi:hypothetical protein
MKKIYLSTGGLIFLSCSAWAETAKQGFSGEIGLFAGFNQTTSNFNTDQETKSIILNSEGKSDFSAAVIPLGQLRYQAGEHQLFIGTSEEDIIKGTLMFEVGYRKQITQNSTFSVSYLPTLVHSKTWEDPYLVNTKRKKTDTYGDAFRIKYEFLSLGVDAIYYDREIDNEKSGNMLSVNKQLLDRNGDGYLVNLFAGLPLTDSLMIEPSITYHQDKADGKAMAYKGQGGGLTFIYFTDNSMIALDTNYFCTKYDAINPLFTQKQKDNTYSVTLSYEQNNIFGVKDISISANAGYSETDANINFYNEKEMMFLMGSTYYF